MNNKILLTFNATLLTLLTAGTSSAQTLINEYDPENITASASSAQNASNTGAFKTIDASGFNTMTGEHGGSTGIHWQSADNGVTAYESDATWDPDTFDEFIQWDLGAQYVLDSIQVWNYNDVSRYDSGINQLDIWVSSLASPGDPEDGGAADWTLLGADVNFSKAPGAAGYTGFDLETVTGVSLPGTSVRWVRFEADSNHWDGGGFGNDGSQLGPNQVALSEIQFYEVVPEPSAFALLAGMFGLAWVMLRRRA